MLNLNYGSSGTPNFYVSPFGFKYYEHLKEQNGESIERIEHTVRNYIVSPEFQNNYPESFNKWSSAEKLLWVADNENQYTTIGHLCREAVQEFADVLIKKFNRQNDFPNKSKTIARIKVILEHKSTELGKTEKPFLDALLSYWRTINYLIQRQEHGKQKQDKDLIWEDGRRVVFQTMIIMYEIDKAL